MSSTDLMGSPAPTKTSEPPTGEAGEGDLERLAREVLMDINNIISDRVAKMLFGEDIVSVEPSENEWNAWVTKKDGLKSFVTGGYLDYMELKAKLVFLVRMRMTEYLVDVQEKLERIKREWREKVGYTQTQ
jgi:hypothetical protein